MDMSENMRKKVMEQDEADKTAMLQLSESTPREPMNKKELLEAVKEFRRTILEDIKKSTIFIIINTIKEPNISKYFSEKEIIKLKQELLHRICQNAMHAQSACNLGAIVRQLGRDMEVIQLLGRDTGEGHSFIEKHPVVRLYLEQIAHLVQGVTLNDNDSYHGAHEYCEEVIANPVNSSVNPG